MEQKKGNPLVVKSIEDYFKTAGLNQAEAARILGVTPQAVSLQLKQPFGKNVSKKWAKAFGFDPNYLMTGSGELFPPPQNLTQEEKRIYDEAVRAKKDLKYLDEEWEDDYCEDDESEGDIEAENEFEFYSKQDLKRLCFNYKWETQEDHKRAVLMYHAADVKIQSLSLQLNYSEDQNKRLMEDIKKLQITITALRRSNSQKEST